MGNLCSKCVERSRSVELIEVRPYVGDIATVTNKGDVDNGAMPKAKKTGETKQPNETAPTAKQRGRRSKRKTHPLPLEDRSIISSSFDSFSDSDDGTFQIHTPVTENANIIIVNVGPEPLPDKMPTPAKSTNQGKHSTSVSKPKSHKEVVSISHNQDHDNSTLVNTSPNIHPRGFLKRDRSTLNDANKLKKVLEMAGSICKLVYPTGFATGIRVGKNKVMVPCHALLSMLESDHFVFASQLLERSVFESLKRQGVYALFNYDTSFAEPLKFYFDGEVHFWDEDTDIAVVSLKQNGHQMPEPFKYFSLPNREFFVIGHPNGEHSQLETVKNIENLNEETSREIVKLRKWSLGKFRRPYDYPPLVDSVHRLLFHCSMVQGASGSPGLTVVDGEHVAVATIFIHNYPDWLYDPEVPQREKDQVPNSHRISQGANMSSVYEKMKSDNRELCEEIFRPSQEQSVEKPESYYSIKFESINDSEA